MDRDMMMYCKRMRNISDSSSLLLSLHDDILLKIFTNLTIPSVLECKTVCKYFYTLLSSPFFAESYLSNPPFTTLIICYGKAFSLLELNSGYDYLPQSSKPKILPQPSVPPEVFRYLVGSCNGFFCYSEEDVLCVSNPLSAGTHVTLPKVVLDDIVCTRSYGFGFCPQSQRYKVVELDRYFTRTEIRVFTLGLDTWWRRVHFPFEDIDIGGRSDTMRPLLYFWEINGKGALHWIVNQYDRLDYMYTFDISDEKVRPIPPPVGLKKRNSSTQLVCMHGCLCLLHMKEEDDNRVYFWCMKDYMVRDSWTLRIISTSCFPISLRNTNFFQPVGAWNNQELLMIYRGSYIVSCNLEKEKFKILAMAPPPGPSPTDSNAAACFVPNFFSHPMQDPGTTTQAANTKDDDAAARKLCLLKVGLGDSRIMRLPNYLLEKIFLRVGVDTILYCKGVCKKWCRFLSNPCFAETYYKLNNTVHLILCDKAALRYFFELKSDLNDNVKASQLLAAESSSTTKTTVLGSCNGLICLSVFVDRRPDDDLQAVTHHVCICNPVTKELAILPQPKQVKRIRDEAYGFGFSVMTGVYKVLRLVTRKWHPGHSEVYVLTIGIDKKNWRRVQSHGVTFGMPKKWPDNINKARFCDMPFNNAIHWLAQVDDSKHVIYAFKVDEELVELLPLPPEMDNMLCCCNYPACLGILRGCLCVLHFQPQVNVVVELWSMRNYGLVTSWTKEIISTSSSLGTSFINPILPLNQRVVIPVGCWRDEEILMWVEQGGGTLLSYCSKKKRCTEIKIDVVAAAAAANNESLIAVPYVQSFLSLRDAVKNGNLEVDKMLTETC